MDADQASRSEHPSLRQAFPVSLARHVLLLMFKCMFSSSSRIIPEVLMSD